MSASVVGWIDWDLKQDKEGLRDYTIDFLVKTTDPDDGPKIVLGADGLPTPYNTYWQYGNDTDTSAICTAEASVKPVYSREKCVYWVVGANFTNRPVRRCSESSFDNPLFEPYRIGGSYLTFSEEAYYDRFGNPIMSSSFEMYEGSEVEFDDGRPTITVGFNTYDLPVNIFAPIMHRVNDSWLWGLPPRTIKLSGMRWQRLSYGTCNNYYTVDYEFEVKYDTWDRYIPDMGTRYVKSAADKDDPTKFIKYQDKNNEYGKCFLKGDGTLATSISQVYKKKIEKYQQMNLLLLGVPADLSSAA